ncbi:MAG: hypothetical protein K2W88_07710 [Pararheinheimera sp.]|nr:hypothetical protein [Rheinheimera sp.]
MHHFYAIVCLLPGVLVSGCAVNGVGIGFDLQETQNPYSQRRSIKGFGLHLDTSASHGGLTLGQLSTELICPRHSFSTELQLKAPEQGPWQSAPFQADLCDRAQIIQRRVQGAALDINPYAVRLVIGLNQQHLIRVRSGESLTLWYDNNNTNPGEIRLYTPTPGEHDETQR